MPQNIEFLKKSENKNNRIYCTSKPLAIFFPQKEKYYLFFMVSNLRRILHTKDIRLHQDFLQAKLSIKVYGSEIDDEPIIYESYSPPVNFTVKIPYRLSPLTHHRWHRGTEKPVGILEPQVSNIQRVVILSALELASYSVLSSPTLSPTRTRFKKNPNHNPFSKERERK